MRRYCKRVDIEDEGFCLVAVRDFLRGKSGRREVQALLDEYGGEEELARSLAAEIRELRVTVAPIQYFNRIEPINGKHRIIGRETPKHQCFDYIAVNGLAEMLMAKIGDYQTASIPGRGQIFAKHAIEKWIREPRAKYFIKLDIRKFYPSIDQDVLRAMLARDVKNEALLYLVGVLLDQFPHGLNIGSFLSQYLANYYASRAYHYAQERLRKTRVNRRTGVVTDKRLVDHVLFYMDDILLMGHDKRDLKMAARRLSKFVIDELHVELKPWKVCAVDREPLDMVGFVFYTYKTTIRPGIFLRARRAFMLAGRSEVIPLPLARRCISYYGYLKHSCSKGVIEKYHAEDTFARCKDVVSLAETERRLDESLFDGGASGRGLPRAPGRLRGHQAAPQHPEGDARADRPCRRTHRGVAG